jgi:IS5 family transposase
MELEACQVGDGIQDETQRYQNRTVAGDKRQEKLTAMGDPLLFLERHMDFAALAVEVNRVSPRPIRENGGGRPPYQTETMVHILIQQIEYYLLNRMSYQRFCRLTYVIRGKYRWDGPEIHQTSD